LRTAATTEEMAIGCPLSARTHLTDPSTLSAMSTVTIPRRLDRAQQGSAIGVFSVIRFVRSEELSQTGVPAACLAKLISLMQAQLSGDSAAVRDVSAGVGVSCALAVARARRTR